MPTAAFDMLGTFFSLESLRPRLTALGAPPHALELWFASALRDFFATSLAGDYAPVRAVLEASLPRTLAELGVDGTAEGPTDPVLAGLSELEPAPGALEACELLRGKGWTLLALTNGGEDATRSLLERAGLLGHFTAVLSTDAVRVSKPHPRVYAQATSRAEGEPWMVAAHAWDLQGARRAGMRCAWVSRKEKRWLATFPPPDAQGEDLAAAARAMLGVR